MTEVEFLTSIVTSIVDDADAVKIEKKEDELGTLLTVQVSEWDMGALIGRGGRTIQAVKTVMRVFGSKHDARVNVKVLESGDISTKE